MKSRVLSSGRFHRPEMSNLQPNSVTGKRGLSPIVHEFIDKRELSPIENHGLYVTFF